MRDLLSSWRKINIPWLEQVEVHRETTRNIRVTVMSFYMGCRVCTYNIILLIIIFLYNFNIRRCNNHLVCIG